MIDRDFSSAFEEQVDPPRRGPDSSNGKEKARRARFNLVPFDDLKTARRSAYLVKGIIPRVGLVVVWGPPKCGKSFWIFTVMLHVTLAWEYRGHRVQWGTVVYLALEGQNGFGDRAEAFRSRYLPETEKVPGFYLVREQTDLIRDHKDLIACIEKQSADPPAVVVVDTMNRSLVGSENEPKDMAQYLRAADAIREKFNCVVIVIHHCGIDGTRPRGHTSLTGAADVQIEVKKDAAGIITSTVEYAKDMAEGTVIASRLEVVELGIDQDGDPITSCVVVPVENGAIRPADPKQEPATLRTFRAAFIEALDKLGETIRIHGDGPTVRAVNVSHVRAEFYRRHATGEEDETKRKAAQRKAFGRALEKLDRQFPRCVMDDQEWIWATDGKA